MWHQSIEYLTTLFLNGFWILRTLEGRYYSNYTLSDYDLYHDSLEIGSSGMYLKFKDGELISVTVTVRGTRKTSGTYTYDGETETRNDERTHYVEFKLKKQ